MGAAPPRRRKPSPERRFNARAQRPAAAPFSQQAERCDNPPTDRSNGRATTGARVGGGASFQARIGRPQVTVGKRPRREEPNVRRGATFRDANQCTLPPEKKFFVETALDAAEPAGERPLARNAGDFRSLEDFGSLSQSPGGKPARSAPPLVRSEHASGRQTIGNEPMMLEPHALRGAFLRC